jgi:hypothetical protein
MTRRLILHLGLWKTGTTTVQTFLRRASTALTAAGIHYPRVLQDHPDHPITRSSQKTAYLREEVSHQALAQEIKRRVHKRGGAPSSLTLWPTAFSQIDESGAAIAIISYEDFSARPEFYDFEVLVPWLRAFDVWGVIYLRPQEDWAVSLYAHMIREGVTELTFADFLPTIAPRLTYSTLLDRIGSCIPVDRLIIGDFAKATETGLIEDFFSKAALPPAPLACADTHAVMNRSPPAWLLLFIHRCRQFKISDDDVLTIRRALIGEALRTATSLLRPGLDLASPAERQLLRDIARADAPRLLDRYGIALDSPVRTPQPWRPFDDEDFKTILDLIAPRISQSARDILRDAS